MAGKETCTHYENQSYMKDVVIVILICIAVLVLREGLAWLLKTNHTHSAVKQMQADVQSIKSHLQIR